MKRWIGLFVTILVVTAFSLQALGRSDHAVETGSVPDVLKLFPAQAPNGIEMPPAYFLHEKHTKALKNPQCTTCHQKDDKGQLVFKYMRLEEQGYKQTKELYHDNCVACHETQKAEGQVSGPLTGDCRSCHPIHAPATSSRQAIVLDRSLHFRHVNNAAITKTADDDEANCSACHHAFDKETKKTFYAKGQEGSCQYCHQEVKTENASAYRAAAHRACLNCHEQMGAQKMATGPLNCSGCHDAAQQGRIKKVEAPPIKRGQPQATLLISSLNAAALAGKPMPPMAKGVAFNHQAHENSVTSCRECHHASLEACGSCHTATGDEKGKYVRLEQAMHQADASQSCRGCHGKAKVEKKCAGCHAAMPVKDFSASDCQGCHSVELPADGNITTDKAVQAQAALQVVSMRKAPSEQYSAEQIPEKVTISLMVNEFEAATFPHGEIVRALRDSIDSQPMAKYFHSQKGTLCAGCHHNSPVSAKPPKCAACHGSPFQEGLGGRPGLKGAYHGQCIGCHQQMGIEKPAANDCVACHPKRKS